MSCFSTDPPASERTDTINFRTAIRNIPSSPLQPYFDSRPVSTKYARMPIIDLRKSSTVPVKQLPTYHPEKTFNPGNDFGPWSGYATNVNNESILRNQIYALQECSQATWIPSSKSDLYQVHWNQPSIDQPFPLLFQKEELAMHNPNPNSDIIGYALFHNATRQQNKNIDNC